MSKIGTIAAIIFLCLISGYSQPRQQKRNDVTSQRTGSCDSGPTPEMQKLNDRFVGTWRVRETFEVSRDLHGKTREGTASFRSAPGSSLIEDYRSAGSAGKLAFLAVIWWDARAQAYQLLTCANSDGCKMRGTARWNRTQLINSWETTVDGKTAKFKDSFADFSPSSFRLISEGKIEGQTIWRVVTTYARMPEAR